MTKQIETVVEAINADAVTELRNTIRQSWINSVKAIYAFAKTHSKASIEASLSEIGLGLSSKANEFTGAAKLGLSEFYKGKWHVCDVQVSRYAKVCKYLNSSNITVDGVEKALEGKTMTELVQNNNAKSEVTEADFRQAVANIEQFYAASKVLRFENDKVNASADTRLQPGPNMAVVVCDAAGNIVAVRRLSGADDKQFREKVISVAGKREVVETPETDLIEEILAEAA